MRSNRERAERLQVRLDRTIDETLERLGTAGRNVTITYEFEDRFIPPWLITFHVHTPCGPRSERAW